MQTRTPSFSAEPGAAGLHVAVVGAGLMGHSIAGVFAAAGATVALVDSDPAVLASAMDLVDRQVRLLGHDSSTLDRLKVSTDLDGSVRGCDVVFEAVREDLISKREVVRRVGAAAPRAVVATNTSALKIAEVARDAPDRSLVVGAHWWNPPHLIPLVELVHGEETSAATAVWLERLLKDVGKVPVHVRRDLPGFIGNRLQHAMWREALALVDAGVCDAETVDTVVRNGFGMRLAAMGPMENADYVGLDLTMAVHDYLFPFLSSGVSSTGAVVRRVAEGDLGRRTGHGFMAWDDGRAAEAASRLEEHLLHLLPVNTVGPALAGTRTAERAR